MVHAVVARDDLAGFRLRQYPALQALEGDSPAAPLWLVAFSATAWRFDDAGGILHGPGIELAARSLYEDGDLRIYSIMGGPP